MADSVSARKLTPNDYITDGIAGLLGYLPGYRGDTRGAYQKAKDFTGLLDWTPLGTPEMLHQAGGLLGAGVRDRSAGGLLGGVGMAALAALPMAGKAAGKVKAFLKELPMDEASRMARAKEQGFVIDAYKGAYPYDADKGPIKGFKDGKFQEIGNIGAIPPELTHFERPGAAHVPGPHAGFFADSPDTSNRFAIGIGEGANYPVKLKFQNPLVIDAGGKPAAAFQFESIAREHGAFAELDAFRGAFSGKNSYDGVILKNTKDEGTVYIPKTPQQVRSRFAAFDPAKLDSKDLLAAVPIVAGLGGAATLPGLLGPQPNQQGREY